MGADFIEKTRKSFEKAWDRQRVKQHDDDLFGRLPTETSRTFAAELSPGGNVAKGDQLVVEAVHGTLVASVGNAEVARSSRPPKDILLAISGSCGLAKATVRTVHAMAGVIEVAIEQ